jgi:hypothetical protein
MISFEGWRSSVVVKSSSSTGHFHLSFETDSSVDFFLALLTFFLHVVAEVE